MYRIVLASAAAVLLAVLPSQAAEYPDKKQAEIAKTAAYVGGDTCKACHGSIHEGWAKTRHTMKARKGPAMGKEFYDNVYAWVQRDWDKLDSHMILDQKDKTTNYVTTGKYKLEDVGFVVGQVRKQRYTVYYDGAPMDAYLQTTKDGGISWAIDKSQTVKYAGNKERAGWKFLTLEMKPKDGEANKNSYGEFYSWQERCIGCHVTGFDAKGWNKAKADFVAGKRKDLKDIFVADIAISCEACHGPGAVHAKSPSKGNIINPTKITNIETRKMVCEQCHTRTAKNLHNKGANDLRGYRIGDRYDDHAEYTRPAWGSGNRQTSIDGKGRRDHQMDTDIRLSATIKGADSVHSKMACFDCHDSHKVGTATPSKVLKKSKEETCVACHGDKAADYMKVLDGSKGWAKYGYGDWANEGGRAAPRQHIFNKDAQGRSYGITPDQYHWTLKKDGDAKKKEDWSAIWPWEKSAFEKKGMKVAVGATPWK
ncbi:MAG: multiheme c-type cytochrome [Desulfuromonadaceae bacterium]